MNQYEVSFIVDPVLSGDEINATAQTYVDHLQSEGCKIVHVDEMGLKQLAYPISKRTSGVYYCIEFSSESGDMISKLELALRRDERIMRFLVVRLDKYGVKYNDDKRKGLIGKKKAVQADSKNREGKAKEKKAVSKTAAPSPAPAAAKAASPAPAAAVAVAEEEE
jgi:small subunit ribosomal protein S6